MAVPRYRPSRSWALFSAGFRPFFLAAGVWACVAMGIWILTLRGLVHLPTAFDAITWHSHELLFGFVSAAIAGFLLTAVPKWTGRLPLQGAPLAILFLLWVLGRAVNTVSSLTGPLTAAAIDVAFLVTLGAVVGREIVAGRNWRNLPILGALALLALTNAMVHAGPLGFTTVQEVGVRLGAISDQDLSD